MTSRLLKHALCTVLAVITTTFVWLPSGAAESNLDRTTPLYTEYNTFIRSLNYLELQSVGTAQANVLVSFFKIDGTFQKAVRVYVDPQTQVDLDVNELVGRVDTYGIVKVEFNISNPQVRLQGRMSIYRLESNGVDYSFAYALPLRDRLTGKTYLTSNTYDPQGRGFVVPNWVSIANLAATSQNFTHNIYDQTGVLLDSDLVTLAPNQRFDLMGGVGTTEAVFLNEIVPANLSTPYISSVVRYASNTLPGGLFRSYLYAMPIFARSGVNSTQFMPITNRTGPTGECWEQTNWVEVLNVSSSTATATLKFRRKSGTQISGSTVVNIEPLGQRHFFASGILDAVNEEIGSVSVDTNTPNSIVTQSVVYFHSCNSNSLQAAYNIPGDVSNVTPLNGSFNRFIDIENELVLFGVGGLNRTVDLSLRQAGNLIHSSSFPLPSVGSDIKFLNDAEFNTQDDTYGLIRLNSNQPYPFISYNLRVRKTGTTSKIIDFVVPIVVR